MYDILGTKHVGCGGTFREINIWEDIACDKCGVGSERYIRTPEEQAAHDAARLERKAQEQIQRENKRAQEIGTVYVLMKVIPYEGDYLQGVYASEEQARRVTGAPASCFTGRNPDYKILRVPVGAAPKHYFG